VGGAAQRKSYRRHTPIHKQKTRFHLHLLGRACGGDWRIQPYNPLKLLARPKQDRFDRLNNETLGVGGSKQRGFPSRSYTFLPAVTRALGHSLLRLETRDLRSLLGELLLYGGLAPRDFGEHDFGGRTVDFHGATLASRVGGRIARGGRRRETSAFTPSGSPRWGKI
jgi:hypothetical protein